MSSFQMDTFGNWSRQLGPDTRPESTTYPFDSSAPVQSAVFWYLWPTTSIAMFPGSPNLIVLSILPWRHKKTSFSGYQYSRDIDQDHDIRQQYLNEVLSPPDVVLCESVQRGLRSQSYDQGRFIVDPELSGIAEHAVHQFHRLVLDALESDKN
jgi:choline monooxygenase